jgi:hypothetical protein
MRTRGESVNKMKQGSSLGWPAMLAAALCAAPLAGAQNLGLGTGSRYSGDSSAQDPRSSGGHEDGAAPRRSQLNKRLGLAARRGQAFDPKVFEARGRELQGQFYEIGGMADPRKEEPNRPAEGSEDFAYQRKGRTQWMVWVGVAGLAGASAGAVGWLYLQKAHPTAAPPKYIDLSDEPPP